MEKFSSAKKEDFLRKARERFSRARDADKDEREDFKKDMKFFHGDQWPQDVRVMRENADPPRPCLVINKVAEKIDQVSGDFRQSRPGIHVVPVDSRGDPEIAEIFGGIIRNIEYNSRAHHVYGSAFDSQITGGRGAWRIKVETEDGNKQIRIVRLPNPLVVYWDPRAQRQDLSDSRYWFVTEFMPEDDFEETYPDKAKLSWDVTEEEQQIWQNEKEVRIAEYWWKEKDKEGKETVRFCTMSAGDILEGPFDWPGKFVPIVVTLGKELWIGGRRTNRGMIRYARTPQQMYNYWSSAITEQIALAPSAPFLVTPTHISTSQEMWDQQAKTNRHYLIYTPDPQAPYGPKREAPPMMSSAISSELQRMNYDIMSAMGLYKASLGDEGQEKSGKAILARQREGDVGAFGYTDLFAAALTHSGRILVDLIPKVYDQEDIVRIRGQDDSQKEIPVNASMDPWQKQALRDTPNYTGPVVDKPEQSPYINDLSIGTYDIQVEIGPSYSTQRQEAAAQLLDIVKTVPQAGIAAIDLIVKNLDLPGADELVKRLKKMVPIGIRELDPNEQPPPQQPDPKMLELALKERDLARKEFEAQMKAIADLVKAEAAEAGQQVAAMGVLVQRMEAATKAKQQEQQMQQQMQQQSQQQNQQPGGQNG
jgi:hypothetical protein